MVLEEKELWKLAQEKKKVASVDYWLLKKLVFGVVTKDNGYLRHKIWLLWTSPKEKSVPTASWSTSRSCSFGKNSYSSRLTELPRKSSGCQQAHSRICPQGSHGVGIHSNPCSIRTDSRLQKSYFQNFLTNVKHLKSHLFKSFRDLI